MKRKKIIVKPIINKRNHQINFNPKKRDIPEDLLKHILEGKRIKMELEEWD